MNKYFGQWNSAEDIENDWAGQGALNGAVVIAATYDNEDYSGSAMVVFRKDGKLFEVHGSHCSCDGLAGWSPEETTYEALIDRLEKTLSHDIDRFGNEFAMALRKGLLDEMFDREVLGN